MYRAAGHCLGVHHITTKGVRLDLNATDYVGPSEAARALGVSARHVLRLIERGQLGAVRTPLGHLVGRASLDRLVKARAAEGSSR